MQECTLLELRSDNLGLMRHQRCFGFSQKFFKVKAQALLHASEEV